MDDPKPLMKSRSKGCLLMIAVFGGGAVLIFGSVTALFVFFLVHKPAPRPPLPGELEFDAAASTLAEKPIQAWAPDPGLVATLEPEVELRTIFNELRKRKAGKSGLPDLGDDDSDLPHYALRLPVDFKLLDANSHAAPQVGYPAVLMWTGPAHPNQAVPNFYISSRAYMAVDKLPTAQELLRQGIEWIGGGPEASRQLVSLDRGRFGDLDWVRGRWTFAGGDLKGEVIKYAAVDQRNRLSILIEMQDVFPYAESTLKLMEAAARSFREKR